LGLGDRFTISIDSLLVLNSNENFVKCIRPIIDTSFFNLESIKFDSSNLSAFHKWEFDSTSSICSGLVFDNGHEKGIYGKGNWGYEKCGENGACDNLSLSFIVSKLPPIKQAVSCPIKGLEILYDGEINTWDHPITCNKQAVYFDSLMIGKPTLDGRISTGVESLSTQKDKELRVYPNPASSHLTIEIPFGKEIHSYRIYTILGGIQQQGIIHQKRISISNLPIGIYQIEVLGDFDRYRKTFIKNSSK
ncbi:MAG: T9SS type A sorting domain-containing protein, partial [Flavobacteriales bacterium]|nr:T9SS type A sorting domain-containing protein [Flavobacteriales bacterium]